MLALIAGEGALPGHLYAQAGMPLVCEIEGFPSGLPDALVFRLETLGSLLEGLNARGVTKVCFAGAIRRPPIDPARIDAATLPLVPRIMEALQTGDDGALRTAVAIFEEAGFQVQGAHEIAPELVPDPGVLTTAEPGDRDRADAARAQTIQQALSAADIGQACVVAAGQALAVETLGGTDWMLDTLSTERRPAGPSGGVLFKAPKDGQDMRVDMPVIGPATVTGAASAGLSGIAIPAGGVMILDRDRTIASCEAAGLFLWVQG
ncbi:MAG: UDP-2,3-diacylglucosamine diphosphatase LpxI [Pseudomonadota bacterium]